MAARLDHIRPISGIRAIAPSQAADDLHLESASTVAKENSLDRREALAFEQAGWKFARTPDANQGQSNVVVDKDGRLKILSDALNVKFDPSASRTDIDAILNSHGLSVRRDMGFSPNLFMVSGAGGAAVEKAKSLNASDKVVYAEPVLIEAIGNRGR